MNKKRRLACLLLVVFICLSFSQQVFAGTTAGVGNYLQKVIETIHEDYFGAADDAALVEASLKGVFDSLDNYTFFYTPKEAEQFLAYIKGDYAGIGAVLIKHGRFTVVYSVFPNSPAMKAGILPGDKIVSVNGAPTVDFSVDKTAGMIRGKEGTEVVLEIIRSGREGILTLHMQRAGIELNPVEFRMINNTAYLKISSFTLNAEKCFQDVLFELDKQNIKKIILDLRDNPGGETSGAVAIARHFVPKGLITRLDFKAENTEDIYYYSSLEQPKYQLVVLVNGNTASASEILAGAVQDTGAGVLLGTNTYGKSKVQTFFPLLTPQAFEKYRILYGREYLNANDLYNDRHIVVPDNEIIGWVKMTTGEYFTPNGRRIDGQGLAPDIAVEDYQPSDGINVYGIDMLRKKEKPGLQMESVDVINAEKILKLLGYEIEEPDILLDEKTFQAIKKYQAAANLYPHGVLDFITQQALNQDLEKLLLRLDKQLAKAVEMMN